MVLVKIWHALTVWFQFEIWLAAESLPKVNDPVAVYRKKSIERGTGRLRRRLAGSRLSLNRDHNADYALSDPAAIA